MISITEEDFVRLLHSHNELLGALSSMVSVYGKAKYVEAVGSSYVDKANKAIWTGKKLKEKYGQ